MKELEKVTGMGAVSGRVVARRFKVLVGGNTGQGTTSTLSVGEESDLDFNETKITTT